MVLSMLSQNDTNSRMVVNDAVLDDRLDRDCGFHYRERSKMNYSSLLQQMLILTALLFVCLGGYHRTENTMVHIQHPCGFTLVQGFIATPAVSTIRSTKRNTKLPVSSSVLLPHTTFINSSRSGIFPSATTAATTAMNINNVKAKSITTLGQRRCRSLGSITHSMRNLCQNDNIEGSHIDDENRNFEIMNFGGPEATSPQVVHSERTIHGNTWSMDQILSQLTLAFPLFVVWFAVMGLIRPTTLLWINRGPMVTILLALVMFGTGLTLQKSDFSTIWDTKANRYSVLLGVLCQFIIMPSTAYIVGRFFFLSHLFIPASSHPIASALFLGLCFVGCSPGGTASNVVTYIANANVALSVVLTSCSTFAAVVVTPLLIQLLLRNTIYGSGTTASAGMIGSSASIQISGWSLCTSTAKVVLLPIMMGMFFKTRLPQMTNALCRFTPFLSVLFVSMICGGVVAQTAAPLMSLSGMGTALTNGGGVRLFPIILSSVLSLHIIGFLAGYIVPKLVLPKDTSKQSYTTTNYELTARTISIEVGMQNSALAVVLARSIPNLHPMACLPGAISATVHSCLGSILAAIWRWQSSQEAKRE